MRAEPNRMRESHRLSAVLHGKSDGERASNLTQMHLQKPTNSKIPYGYEILPERLKPEWLLPGDLHMVVGAKFGHRRVGSLDFDTSGHLRLDRKRISRLAYVTLYPAAVFHEFLSQNTVV